MIEKIKQLIAKLNAKVEAAEEIKLSQVETEEVGVIEINEDGSTTAADGIYTVKDGAGVKIEVKDGVATIIEPATEEVKDEVKQEEEVKDETADTTDKDSEKVAELEAKVAELEKQLADEKAKNTQLSAEKTKVETKLSEVSKQPAGKRLVMSVAEDAKPLTEIEKKVQARLAEHKASL